MFIKPTIALLLNFSLCMLVIVCAPKITSARSRALSAPHHLSQSSFNLNQFGSVFVVTRQSGGGGGGYLGVYLGDVNEESANRLKLAQVRGAVVGKVEEGSPAATAGLSQNDVILSFNDQEVQNRAQFYRLLVRTSPGSKVKLTVMRNGELRYITAELGQRNSGVVDERSRLFSEPDAMMAAAKERRREAEEFLKKGEEKRAQDLFEEEKAFIQQAEERRAFTEKQIREGKINLNPDASYLNYNVNANRYYLGLIGVQLSDQLKKYFNVDHGVLVSEVRAGGAAERAGIKAGDCITAVDNDRVASLSDLNRHIDSLSRKEVLKEKAVSEFILSVVRDRVEQKIKIKIESR